MRHEIQDPSSCNKVGKKDIAEAGFYFGKREAVEVACFDSLKRTPRYAMRDVVSFIEQGGTPLKRGVLK